MVRTCTVCRHPEHEAINAALVIGRPHAEVAAAHGLGYFAIRRHHRAHLPAAMVKAEAAREVTRADDLLGQVHQLREKALALLEKAEAAGDHRGALQGIREARGCVELLAKLLGELDESPKIAVLMSPEWGMVRGLLMTALAPYPEARAAVAGRLLLLEAGHGAR